MSTGGALLQTRYRIGLAAAALVLCAVVCHRLLETPMWSVNGSRLMPSLGLANGINYYVLFPPGGPLYSTLYGPMMAIVYLPATLFPSPNSAVLAGAAITALLCFGATAFVHFAAREPGSTGVNGLAFLAAGFFMCYLDPLKYSCFNIHADGPGLAFGAVACGALYPGRLEKWRVALPLSAFGAVLAIFSKQMFLPVPIALLAYLWLAEGRTRAARYLLWLVGAGLLAGAAAMAAWGPAQLYHCLIWLPAHHPWNSPSHLVSAIQAARSFVRVSMPVPLLLLAALISLWMSGWTGVRAAVRDRSAPLLLAGVALLPFSVAGRAKTGGDVNSLSFALFFLTCGLTVMLADAARTRRLAVSVLAATVVLLAVSEGPLAFDIPASARQVSQSAQEVACAYLKRHPGAAYFPGLPLAHYYAEHQFRHYSFGIADRLLAGESIPLADFRAYIPRDARIIGFAADGPPQVFGFDLMKYFPEYREQVHDPALPGFLVYGK
jgi:hypothetical protein